MLFSIVIPTYNSSRMLRRCLDSIKKIEYPDFEIIVVDDGSTDDTADMVKEYSNVRYVYQENQGPAAARNRGVAEAAGDLIFFTDADCVLPPDILSRYASIFAESSYAGVGGGYRTLNKESKVARYIGWEIAFRHDRARPMETKAFGTYNAVFVRQAFVDTGGFDTGFTMASGEDFDLCYRLVNDGRQLGFDPDIFVYHEHPDSIGKYLKQQLKRGETRLHNVFRHKRAAISDNYVGKNEKWQPVLLCGIISGGLLALLFPPAGAVFTGCFTALLLLSNRPFYAFIFKRDPALLPLSILLSFLKPVAWGLGGLKYLLARKYPPPGTA